jgi:anti-sigma regulatory factor (Ser/Thr protein kinase)
MQPAASKTLALRTSQFTYPGAAEHIRRVRDDLRPLLTGCPIADEIILCASELAANAALHSNSRFPGGTFTVRAQISPGHHVRIEVQDNGAPGTPSVTSSAGHHGLDIVSTLATDWGTDGDRTTRITWARFDWAGHS